MTNPLLRDLALLIARLGLGIVFVAHGWQKWATFGHEGTASAFENMGVPMPSAAAFFAATVELIGGAALILGAAVPVAGLLLAVNMAGAFLFVHATKGVFVTDGGFELVLALGVGALLLAATGAGRFGVDHVLGSRLRRSRRSGRPEVGAAAA
ncbi:DoxX family protein [Micromonospora sp. NPDC049679]|uniref:DoxX family protein n=1 Tax=Micromonospora sp. NPDC049679 TaxID=3155920 RepID=UPI0033E4F921